MVEDILIKAFADKDLEDEDRIEMLTKLKQLLRKRETEEARIKTKEAETALKAAKSALLWAVAEKTHEGQLAAHYKSNSEVGILEAPVYPGVEVEPEDWVEPGDIIEYTETVTFPYTYEVRIKSAGKLALFWTCPCYSI